MDWTAQASSPLARSSREKTAVTSLSQSRMNRLVALASQQYKAGHYKDCVSIYCVVSHEFVRTQHDNRWGFIFSLSLHDGLLLLASSWGATWK